MSINIKTAGVHHFALLNSRAGQERVEFVDDKHAHMAGAEQVNDLIAQLGY